MGDLGGAGDTGDSAGTEGGEWGVDGSGKPLPNGAAATDIRRLRKGEFAHTFRQLLPALPSDFDPALDLPRDNHVELAFAVPGTVSDLEVKRFADVAEEAILALGSAAPGSVYSCATDEAACARTFITEMATKAFRRPPFTEEVDDLFGLYSNLRGDPEIPFEFVEALNVVVEALLQSPGFLYRWEQGPQGPKLDGDFVAYGSYEMASRLSYFLWNAGPDEALLQAAEGGTLTDPLVLEEQARRMMTDEKFDVALGDFITQWLEVSELPTIVKDTGVYPNFNPALAQAMYDEAKDYARLVFRGSDPTFSHLLSGTTTAVSPELGAYYGVSVAADGTADLTATARRGILTQGAVLSAKGNSYRTSPVRRGKFILNRLLCSNVPPPPPDAVVDLPPADPNLSLREQLAQHASSPSCANCHSTMDPLGLAFENFDGAGAYREKEGNLDVDASGQLEMGGDTWAFQNALELIELLQGEEAVHDCFATQWVRYALGRFEQKEEAGGVHRIVTTHRESASSLDELVVAIVTSKSFSHRALRAGEVPRP